MHDSPAEQPAGTGLSPAPPEAGRPARRSWAVKFRDAFRGARLGIGGQNSFVVHFFAATAVLVTAGVLGLKLWQWCVLLLCIAAVLTAEMFNSALESLARAVTRQHDPHIGQALDTGSAAVLVSALGAATVGTLIFAHRLGQLLGWW